MGSVYLPTRLQKKTWRNISQMQANIPALSIRHGKDRFYRHYSLFYWFLGKFFHHIKTNGTSQLFNFWRSFGCWYTSILLNVTKKKDTWRNEKHLLVSRFPSVQKRQNQRCHCSSRMHCKWCPWDIPTWVAVRQNPPNSDMNFWTYWVWWTSSSDIRGCLVVSHAQPFSHDRFLQWFLSLHGLFFGWEELATKQTVQKPAWKIPTFKGTPIPSRVWCTKRTP